MPDPTLRIIIAEDDEPISNLLKDILSTFEGVTVVGKTSNGRNLLELAKSTEADAVFLDIQLPVVDGLSLARRLQERWGLVRPVSAAVRRQQQREHRRALEARIREHHEVLGRDEEQVQSQLGLLESWGKVRAGHYATPQAAQLSDEELLARLLADPYLDRPPPKTTGRERYGLPLCRRLSEESGLPEGALADPAAPFSLRQRALDLVATVTAFTARSIAEAYRRWLPPIDEVIVSGGGSRNPALLSMLRAALDPVPVVTLETYGIDSKAKEAMAFALLAHDGLLGLPTNVPGATGARRRVILGTLTPPIGIAPRRQGKEG